jgi:flagellar basal-body rod protein FlgC
MFNAIGTAGTGLTTYHTWLDAIANNIANVNDTAPTNGQVFKAEFVQASALGPGPDGVGSGVTVSAETEGGNGVLANDPTNPLADREGNYRRADIDLSQQMGNMIMAQRGFQANASVIDRAKEVYEAAISIGKGI